MRYGRFAAAAGVVVLVAASALAGRPIDEKKAASPTGTVEISNVAGSVRVTGWDRAEIAVRGTLGEGAERLDFSVTGDRALIKVVLPRNGHNVESSNLEISLPAGSRVEGNTVSADITVAKVAGKLELESVSGDIVVEATSKEVDARTVSGSIKVAAPAAVRAKSVSGVVNLKGPVGEVHVASVSGVVTIAGGPFADATIETTSGRIRVDGDLAKDGRLEAKSVSGSVELALPAAVAARFEVSTLSGKIENEFGAPARRTSEYGPGHELEFTNAGGGARIRVRTFSGSVTLRKR